MQFNHVLAFAQFLTFAITAITSIPLLVSYLRDVGHMSPVFIHLHVWFGLAFIVVALIKMSGRRKLILNQLGLKINKKK